MRRVFACLVVSLSFVACKKENLSKYRQQLRVTNQLLNHIKVNDTLAVLSMYGGDPSDIERDSERVMHMVSFFYNQLQDLNEGKSRSFKFVKYADNDARLVDIEVPFFNSQGKKEYTMTVFFVKYIPEDKIFYFNVDRVGPVNVTLPP